MHLDSHLDIPAPADVVWSLTIDVESLPRITPTVRSVERLDTGPLRVGSQVRLRQPLQPPRVWTITDIVPGRRFEWSTPALGGTMTGTHTLTPTADGTRNSLAIDLTGRFARLVAPFVRGSVRRALATENAGLCAAAVAAFDQPTETGSAPRSSAELGCSGSSSSG